MFFIFSAFLCDYEASVFPDSIYVFAKWIYIVSIDWKKMYPIRLDLSDLLINDIF